MDFHFSCVTHSRKFISEEEASKLRFYVDEPAYTDLHWVCLIPCLDGIGRLQVH